MVTSFFWSSFVYSWVFSHREHSHREHATQCFVSLAFIWFISNHENEKGLRNMEEKECKMVCFPERNQIRCFISELWGRGISQCWCCTGSSGTGSVLLLSLRHFCSKSQSCLLSCAMQVLLTGWSGVEQAWFLPDSSLGFPALKNYFFLLFSYT